MKETYLVHHGIQGQRWRVRRYQNEDGTPWYNHWKYCFDCLINYVGESCY